MKKKRSDIPYRSVKKLQTYFDDNILFSDNAYPMADIFEQGTDGVYRAKH